MANVVYEPDRLKVPHDETAVYVWPGIVGPEYGTLSSFTASISRAPAAPPDTDWFATIERAQVFADRTQARTIDVVGHRA